MSEQRLGWTVCGMSRFLTSLCKDGYGGYTLTFNPRDGESPFTVQKVELKDDLRELELSGAKEVFGDYD